MYIMTEKENIYLLQRLKKKYFEEKCVHLKIFNNGKMI